MAACRCGTVHADPSREPRPLSTERRCAECISTTHFAPVMPLWPVFNFQSLVGVCRAREFLRGFTLVENLACGDYDHRHSDRAVAAGGASGPRGGATQATRQQHQTSGLGAARLPRLQRLFPPGMRARGPSVEALIPGGHYSWSTFILPYLEQQGVYDLLRRLLHQVLVRFT